MRIEPLLSFCTVVEQESFSRAASMLHLTQPAVSMNIKQLEKEYGQLLLRREGKRSFTLTPLGEELYALTRDLRNHLERIELHKKDAVRESKTEITIKGNSAGGIYLLTQRSAMFQEMHPGVHFTISQEGTEQAIKALWNGDIDLALLMTSTPPADLQPLYTWEDELNVIVPAQHPFANQFVAAEELFKHPLVLAHKGSPSRAILDEMFKERLGTPVNCMLELGNPEAVKQTIVTLNKPGIVLKHTVKNELESGLLTIVNTDFQFHCQHTLYCIQKRRMSETLGTFTAFLNEQS